MDTMVENRLFHKIIHAFQVLSPGIQHPGEPLKTRNNCCIYSPKVFADPKEFPIVTGQNFSVGAFVYVGIPLDQEFFKDRQIRFGTIPTGVIVPIRICHTPDLIKKHLEVWA